MKKILVTTLALALAVVSTIDARKVGGGQPVARQMNANSKALVDANAPVEVKDAAAAELIELFKQNPNELELMQLMILHKQKDNEVKAKQAAIAAMKVGFFDFNNVEYKKAKGELDALKAELKNLEKDIRAQIKVVGPDMSNAVKLAVTGLIAAAGLAAVDRYFGSPVGTWIMEKGGEVYTYAEEATRPYREAIGRGVARAREYLPSARTILTGEPEVVEQPVAQENIYGRAKRRLARMAGTTEQKFPNE